MNWALGDGTAQSAVVLGAARLAWLFAVRCNSRSVGGSDGTIMTDSFLHIESTGLGRNAGLASGQFSDSAETTIASQLRVAVGWLPIVVILAAAVWLLLSDHTRKRDIAQPRHSATAAAIHAPAKVGLAKGTSFDPLTSEAIAPEQPAPVDGLKITSQSWRRGGLGSNAFVTMTLRNTNEYAVKNIEISCAFARPDGSHLTDRTRLIHDTINTKSRKTFVRLHVGFVNVYATKAKCALLAANHI